MNSMKYLRLAWIQKNLQRLGYSDTDTGGDSWRGETWKKFGSQERLLHSE